METVNDLPIQNLTIQEDKKEEELPEVTHTLVSPPEVSAAAPVTEVMKQENIAEEEDNEGLTDQEKDTTEEGRVKKRRVILRQTQMNPHTSFN